MTRNELISELLESGEPRTEHGWDKAIDRVLEIIDKDIDFYRQLGKPDNQHRDVINAFKDFRAAVLALKGEQE